MEKMDHGLEEVPELRGSEVHVWRPGGSSQREAGDCCRAHSSVICGCARLDGKCCMSLRFKWPLHLAEADQNTLVTGKMKPNNKVTQSFWVKETIMVLLSLWISGN